MQKAIISSLAFIFVFVFFPVDAKADCLVAEKSGNIRSGPGTHYDIVGKVEKWQIIDIPGSFKVNAKAAWFPIEEKIEHKSTIKKGWYHIETQLVRKYIIVEGWYREKPWKPGIPTEIGDRFFFLMDDTEVEEDGCLVEKLPGERIFGVTPYKHAKFRILGDVEETRQVKIGDKLHFLVRGHEARPEYWTGCLVEKLPEKRMIDGLPHQHARFRVVEDILTYPKWIHRSLVSVINRYDVHRYVSIGKSGFSNTIQNKLIERKVWIGMTKKMALLSWGEPDDINKTITARGVREQWLYRYSDYKAQYLYFNNGILTAIQTH